MFCRLLVCYILLLLSLLSSFSFAQLQNNTDALNYQGCHSVPAPCVRVAVLLTLISEAPVGPLNGPQVQAALNLTFEKLPVEYATDFSFLTNVFQGAELVNQLLIQAGGIPMYVNNDLNAPLTYVNMQVDYYNVGMDWIFLAGTNHSLTRVEQVVYSVTDGSYHVVIPPQGLEAIVLAAAEATKQTIALPAILEDPSYFVCQQGLLTYQPPCQFADRRRFSHTISVAFDTSGLLSAVLDQLRAAGYLNVGMLYSNDYMTVYPVLATRSRIHFEGMTQVYSQSFLIPHPTNDGSFPPLELPVPTISAWSAEDIVDIVQDLQSTQVQILLLINIGGDQVAIQNFRALLQYMQSIDWVPEAIVAAGNWFDQFRTGLLEPGDLELSQFIIYEGLWVENLNDNTFLAVNGSGTNQQLFSSTEEQSSPQIYAETLSSVYYHGQPIDQDAIQFSVVASTALIMVQQLVQVGGNANNVATMLANSQFLLTPSIWGLLQLDPFGRVVSRDFVVLQVVPGDVQNQRVVAPLSIGQGIVLPVPNWSQRTFHSSIMQSPEEKILVALAILWFVAQLVLFALPTVRFRDNPVIKASTYEFHLIILIGSMMMLSTIGIWLPEASTARCNAALWTLTVGFTLQYCPLFLRTLRISLIWNRTKLEVVHLPTSSLVKYLLVFVLIDVVLNSLLSSLYLSADYVVVDQFRPASNYYICSSVGAGTAILSLTLSLKALWLVIGLVLAFKARKADPLYNESLAIFASIFVLFIVSVVIIPLLISQLQSQMISYIFRSLALLLCVGFSNVSLLGYKLYLIFELYRKQLETYSMPVKRPSLPNNVTSSTHKPPIHMMNPRNNKVGPNRLNPLNNSHLARTAPVVIHTRVNTDSNNNNNNIQMQLIQPIHPNKKQENIAIIVHKNNNYQVQEAQHTNLYNESDILLTSPPPVLLHANLQDPAIPSSFHLNNKSTSTPLLPDPAVPSSFHLNNKNSSANNDDSKNNNKQHSHSSSHYGGHALIDNLPLLPSGQVVHSTLP